MIAAYELKPRPLPPIPDDPPPHEGALIDLPYVVEPPDLIIVEVLEALPGRPISGERLVKPDGKISVSFYGEIPVRGLSLLQVKVAVIKQLRKYLTDECLGLITPILEEADEAPAGANPAGERKSIIPELPQGDVNPFEGIGDPRPSPDRPRSARTNSSLQHVARGRIPVRPARAGGNRVESQDQDVPAKEQKPIRIDADGKGKVTITIEIDSQGHPASEPPFQPVPPRAFRFDGPWRVISPEETDRVFVDITAYHSKNYYVEGLVHTPGRLPCTGGETVLDAIQFAGGLLASVDPSNIILVRPGRAGKPSRTYPVDLLGIRERGETATNYQLFPGDRLIVGSRSEVRKEARR